MNIYNFFNEIFFSFFEAVTILLLFVFLINKRNFFIENKIKSCIFIMIYTTFSYFATTYIPIGYHTIIITIFTIISLHHITSSNFITAFIFSIVIISFIMITEGVVFLLYYIFKNMGVDDIMKDPSTKFQLSFIAKNSQIMIILFLYKFKKPPSKQLSSTSHNPIFSYLVIAIFLVSVFLYSINYAISSNVSIIIYGLLFFFIFLSLILLAFLDYKDKEKLLKIKHKFELQEEYVHNIETVIDIIRKEKHDFANHVNTIHAMCILNKPDTVERIKVYLDKLVNNLHSSYHYYNSGNDYIDGLLAVKSNFAFNHDIHFDVEFEDLLNNIAFDEYDLISIISNLIDNAFEAIMSESDVEGSVVSICTYMEDDKYCISIANNGPMISEGNVKNIFEKGFSTKEKNKTDHGFGLYIVKQLIEKNDGKITVISNENETEFLMKLSLERVGYGKIST